MFLVASPDRKPLLGILALIFLLVMTLSEVTSSQANEAGKPNALHQAAQGWMRVGIQQYQRSLFKAAEQSFRRAQVFKKYLTAAEREQLNELLQKARIAESEGKHILADTQTVNKLVEQDQPIEANTHVEKLEDSEPLTKKEPEQSAQRLKEITSQPSEQEKQTVEKAELSVTGNEEKVVPSEGKLQGSIKSLINKLTQYFSGLNDKQWRRWGLLTAGMLTIFLLLLIERRKRKETVKRVYENPVLVQESSSVIGARLAGCRQNHKGIELLEKDRVAYVPKSDGRPDNSE
jgi:hypothetical protein